MMATVPPKGEDTKRIEMMEKLLELAGRLSIVERDTESLREWDKRLAIVERDTGDLHGKDGLGSRVQRVENKADAFHKRVDAVNTLMEQGFDDLKARGFSWTKVSAMSGVLALAGVAGWQFAEFKMQERFDARYTPIEQTEALSNRLGRIAERERVQHSGP